MNAKYYELNDNEVVYLINPQTHRAIEVSRNKKCLNVDDVKDIYEDQNIEITTINFDELKSFVLAEIYYQQMMGFDLDSELMKKLSDVLDYHFEKIYGPKYNKEYGNIKEDKYQCIVSFNK